MEKSQNNNRRGGNQLKSFIEESLSQNLFWLNIMREHSIFLRLGLPCERTKLIEKARFFETAFERQLTRFRRLSGPSTGVVRDLNEESIILINRLIEFKTLLLFMMLRCELGGFNYPLLIDHIRREAINFLHILNNLQQGETCNRITRVVQKEVFWLRIMSDHSKFISHLLDPSERQFVKTANDFSDNLDMLRFQAEDFESFLSINPIFVPSLTRFNGDVISEISKLRDFKASAKELISRCEIVSLIPELLADHVLREANHALVELRSI